MITRIEIDPNVRVRANGTFSAFRHVHGPLAVGQDVEVYETEDDIVGKGRITEIDVDKHLVYLSVDWSSLKSRQDCPMEGAGALSVSSDAVFLTLQPGFVVKVADMSHHMGAAWGAGESHAGVFHVPTGQIDVVVSG